jgi:hypothetical protein
VMNTRDELVQAFADYEAGRLGTIPAIAGVHGTPVTIQSTGESRPAGQGTEAGPK